MPSSEACPRGVAAGHLAPALPGPGRAPGAGSRGTARRLVLRAPRHWRGASLPHGTDAGRWATGRPGGLSRRSPDRQLHVDGDSHLRRAAQVPAAPTQGLASDAPPGGDGASAGTLLHGDPEPQRGPSWRLRSPHSGRGGEAGGVCRPLWEGHPCRCAELARVGG